MGERAELSHWLPGAALVLAAALGVASARAVEPPRPYHAIVATDAGETVVLTGRDLTIEQLLQIAQGGAKVALSPAARVLAKDTYGLLLEAGAEGVPVYNFNRGAGVNREVVTFTGDPTAPETKAKIEQGLLRQFQNGARAGVGPEMDDEAEVRAMMAVRANTMIYDAPSPQLMQMLLDLLNHRVTPVVQGAASSVGQGDLTLMQNVGATMVGRGEAYLDGVRMPAAQALAKAGLQPITPFGEDGTALTSTNAFTASQAALLVAEGERTLRWADLIYGMDLLGMDSSITPLAAPAQLNRPDPWLNWHAGRMLTMLKGSYLFDAEPKRILADPDSLRASSIRQASAWRAWAELRDAALFQINSSDHNPTFRVGLAPSQSWELSTPMMMHAFVKGGPLSGGKSGYVTATANWDPFPLTNQVEAFTIALANMDVAVVQRFLRFAYPFHTGVQARDVLTPAQAAGAAPQGNGVTVAAYWAAIVDEAASSPAMGLGTDNQDNGDIESQLPIKIAHARETVQTSLRLLSQDMMTAAYWMDVRQAQDSKRGFGGAPAQLWMAYRKVSPWGMAAADRPDRPAGDLAYGFLTGHAPSEFDPAPVAFPK